MRPHLLLLLSALPLLACGRDAPKADGETLSAFGTASGVERADSGDRAGHRIIPLRPMTGDVEILHGDPEKAGEPFVMRINELPGTVIPLHSHPVDEHITVVQGPWYFAVGDTWDQAKLQALAPGTYAFAPKGATMYGSSPDGAVVQVHGIGPFHIHWKNGAVTLDDPDGRASFRYRKGDRVQTPRGAGTIRQGYRSGDIIQYEIQGEGGGRFMASETDVRRS